MQAIRLIAFGTVLIALARLAYFVGWMTGTEAAVSLLLFFALLVFVRKHRCVRVCGAAGK